MTDHQSSSTTIDQRRKSKGKNKIKKKRKSPSGRVSRFVERNGEAARFNFKTGIFAAEK